MPLFVCTTCTTVDNTAIAPGFWDATRQPATLINCTRCITGKWHDRFPERKYDEQRDGPIGNNRIIRMVG